MKSNIATITILARRHARYHYLIALGTKGDKVCKGKLVFPGGRVEPADRSIRSSASRERREESGVRNISIIGTKEVGRVDFFESASAQIPRWIAHVYWSDVCWDTPLIGSPEWQHPRWYALRRMPWDRMMPGDKAWFHAALASTIDGLKFRSSIRYDREKTRVLESSMRVFRPNEWDRSAGD